VSKKNRERKYGSSEAAKGGGSDLLKFYWTIGVVAVLGLGIVGWSVGSKALSPTVSQPIQVAGIEDPMKLMQLAQGITRGDPDAPVTIIEFGDFQCPACGSFFSAVEPQVEAEFISTGKANFRFMDFPLVQMHPNAFLAARAGRCANDQARFWPYHDMLYRMQGRWSNLQNPAGAFEDYAKDLGLNTDEFATCLRSDKHADVISASLELGTQLQLAETPTIMIGAGKGGQPRRVASSIQGIREGIAVITEELGNTQ
jgi:protein-disulfide isomerase